MHVHTYIYLTFFPEGIHRRQYFCSKLHKYHEIKSGQQFVIRFPIKPQLTLSQTPIIKQKTVVVNCRRFHMHDLREYHKL